MKAELPDLTWSQLLFSFEGRISRRIYVWRCLPLFSVYSVLLFVGGGFLISVLRGEPTSDGGISASDTAIVVALALAIAYVWASAATLVKRLHDRNRSGWLGLVSLIPFVSLLITVDTALRAGTRGPNKYGVAPLRLRGSRRPDAAPGWGAFFVDLTYYPLLLLLLWGFRIFLFEPFNIPARSMLPTLMVGDYFLVSKYSYGYGRYLFPFGRPAFEGRVFGAIPKRGDVAVFRLPHDPSIDYVKRIVGLPGDRIQMIDGWPHLNGTAVPRELIGKFDDVLRGRPRSAPRFRETLPDGAVYDVLQEGNSGPLDSTPIFEVPLGHFFVLGDYRTDSLDSRVMPAVGYVPIDNRIGRAEYRFLSVEGETALWRVWEWPSHIRYGRLFTMIR